MTDGWLVFTDLDGTLLDHESYDFSPALPALRALKQRGIPLVLVSSKTLDELRQLARTLNIQGPVVAENGAVIAYPGETPQIAPPGYHLLRDFLIDQRSNPDFDTLGFGDMSLEEVMQATGLPRDDARLAMRRLASEPFLWRGEGESLAAFRKEAGKYRLRLHQGGRFMHLQSDTDKGIAVNHVINRLRRTGKHITRTIALGDSDNDREMLLAVDHPVIIRKPNGSHLTLPERPDAILSELPGPAGWNQTILQLLQKYTDNTP